MQSGDLVTFDLKHLPREINQNFTEGSHWVVSRFTTITHMVCRLKAALMNLQCPRNPGMLNKVAI